MKLINILDMSRQAIRANRLRATLSIVGVTLGVAAVIASTILGEDNRRYIEKTLADLARADILWLEPARVARGVTKHREIPGERRTVTPVFSLKDMEAIRRQASAVQRAVPYRTFSETVRYKNRQTRFVVIGAPPEIQSLYRLEFFSGRPLQAVDDLTRAAVCVVEQSPVSEWLFGGEDPVGQSLRLGEHKLKIIGYFRTLFSQVGAQAYGYLALPLGTLQKIRPAKGIEIADIQASTLGEVERAAYQAGQVMLQRYDFPKNFSISHPGKYLKMIRDTIGLIVAVIIGIAAISLTVGGIGIMNIMLVSAMERTREIGILKSLGMKKGDIRTQFLLEATTLSLIGGFLGIIIGVLVPAGIVPLLGLPYYVPGWVIPVGFFISVAVGIIAGFYPANLAANLEPVETLRHE